MPDRGTIFQNVQLGPEVTPGTAVLATRKLNSLSIEPSINLETNPFAARGNKIDSLVVPNREWTAAAVSGQPAYNELPYIFCSLIKNVSPTTLGASTKRWAHISALSAPDTVKTYTVEQGDPYTQAERMVYGLFNSMEFVFARDEVSMSGTMIGQRLVTDIEVGQNEIQTLTVTGGVPTSGDATLTVLGAAIAAIPFNATAAQLQTALDGHADIDPGEVIAAGGPWPGTGLTVTFAGRYAQTDVAAITAVDTFDVGDVTIVTTQAGAAPTTQSLVPIVPTHVNFYLADTYAGLASAQALTRAFRGVFRINDRFGPIWPVNRSFPSFAGHVEVKPTVQAELSLEADSVGMALVPANMRTGTPKWLRFEAVGGATEVGQTYLFQIDMAGAIEAVSEFEDYDGVFGLNYTFRAVIDPAWPGGSAAYEVISQSLLAAL